MVNIHTVDVNKLTHNKVRAPRLDTSAAATSKPSLQALLHIVAERLSPEPERQCIHRLVSFAKEPRDLQIKWLSC